jgi:hypothetical protein
MRSDGWEYGYFMAGTGCSQGRWMSFVARWRLRQRRRRQDDFGNLKGRWGL